MTKISDLSLVSSPTSGDSFPILQAGSNRRITFSTLFGSLPGPINMSTSGTAAAPVFSFNTDTNTGIYRVGADQLGISTRGDLAFTISKAPVLDESNIIAPNQFNIKVGSTLAFIGTTSQAILCAGGVVSLTANATNVQTGSSGELPFLAQRVTIADGVTAPSTILGFAHLYVDSADGDLKIKYGDGTVKTIVVDT